MIDKNRGVLFKNTRKRSDKSPDYTGSWYDDKGTEYFLSAWLNESANGKMYMSLVLGDKKEPRPAHPSNAEDWEKPATPINEDDVPF